MTRGAGLVAAAGRSSRMGRCKALLPLGETTFVEHLVRVFLSAGLDPVIVTVPEPPDDIDVIAALADLRCVAVRNAQPELGLSGSVGTALAHLGPEIDALAICPVDAPFVDAAVLKALLAALPPGGAAAPEAEGQLGHPVIFARGAFSLLETADVRGGPRGVIRLLGDLVHREKNADPRVLENVNTPADYARLFGAQSR